MRNQCCGQRHAQALPCFDCPTPVSRARGPVPRAKVEKIARNVQELIELRELQRVTTAKMIRGCIPRLKSHSSKERAEALKALDELATMLEKSE